MERAERESFDGEALLAACEAELERGAERRVSLQLVCDLLHRRVNHYDWVGFYLAVPDQQLLVLGPYQGDATDHIRIPYGTGICGQAATREATFRIDDVNAQDNYLACSIRVKSEIVVPVFQAGSFVAEIDIDSHQRAAFTAADQEFLEALAVRVAPYIPDVQRGSPATP